MKKLAIIPARYHSSRFPGKPLIDLDGKSMIRHVYEGVNNSRLFDTVVVATDHEKIRAHVKQFGGNVLMTHSDHRSGTDRCGEVIETYSDYDIVVNIQGDEPLVDAEQLRQLLETFDDDGVKIATLGIPTNSKSVMENPNRIKIVRNSAGDALYFSRSPIPYEKEATQKPFLKHIGLYGFRKTTLEKLVALPPTDLEKKESLEQLRWLFYGYSIRVAKTTIETPNIDVPEDVAVVMNELRKKRE